ncbi:Type 1 glutamine amidotransferase-like domain-containing protein [Clostridium sp. HMP27]|uniref:Type 1 glutamine amidotransferase-like domain-containing protein n=1 Tax=Clostridium sp. HMP27 TaxID=1487921 RepID=UPI00052BF23B|nr:Type 1 glutamine amidotransferase-like domain-containing protein [Clostridium sp. HMP27]KGK90110.1 peptidase S51 [Clostridium sp. HMP27]
MVNMLFSSYNFHEDWARNAVSKYINFNDKVLIIPFSFGNKISSHKEWQNAYSKDNGKYYESIITPLLNYGIREENIDWLNYFKDTKENAKTKIRDSSILFFTGGLPDKTMLRLMEFDLINNIESFTGVVIGISAGAMIQIAEYHITPDKDYNKFTYNIGLNLIKGFDIEVHYQGTEIQNKYINKVLNEKRDRVYAITNIGGLIIDDSKVISLGNTKNFSRKNICLKT